MTNERLDTPTAVSSLGALAQASRLAVFQRLVELGPDGANPGELALALGIPGATLSFHLKALLHAGLVGAEPRGRFIVYRANFARMQALVEFLTRNCCGGDPSRCEPDAPTAPACASPRKRARSTRPATPGVSTRRAATTRAATPR